MFNKNHKTLFVPLKKSINQQDHLFLFWECKFFIECRFLPKFSYVTCLKFWTRHYICICQQKLSTDKLSSQAPLARVFLNSSLIKPLSFQLSSFNADNYDMSNSVCLILPILRSRVCVYFHLMTQIHGGEFGFDLQSTISLQGNKDQWILKVRNVWSQKFLVCEGKN